MLQAVLHLDELEKWPLTLGNVRNLLKTEQPLQLVVLANSVAVKGYFDDQQEQEITRIAGQGVQFIACQNALTAFDLSRNDLPEGVQTVPTGVFHLIELQGEGYAYIKP